MLALSRFALFACAALAAVATGSVQANYPSAPSPTFVTKTPTPCPTPSTKTPSPSSAAYKSYKYAQSPCDVTIKSDKLIDVSCAKSDRIKFIGLGDWGETSETTGVLAVRDGLVKQAQTGEYAFILAVGDNFYNNGVASVNDSQWRTTWYERWGVGSNITLPWIALLGNHDYGNASAQIAYFNSSQPEHEYWLMPSQNYSVDATIASGEKFKLVITDTQYIGADADYEWLAEEFADDSASLVYSVGHHNIYSAAAAGDNSSSWMVRLRDVIEDTTSVKAYICGHEHDMQYLRANSTDYFMIGGGGRSLSEGQTYPGTAAETVYFSNSYGFALYDVDPVNKVVDITYHVYNSSGVRTDVITFTRYY